MRAAPSDAANTASRGNLTPPKRFFCFGDVSGREIDARRGINGSRGDYAISLAFDRKYNTLAQLSGAEAERFVQLLTSHQPQLYAYIRSLLPEAERASDVLQETNLVLWQRAAEFAPESNFGGWARKVAYFQVLAHYRDRQREKLTFDTELVAVLAAEQEEAAARYEERRRQLQRCLGRLSEASRDLLRRRYAPGGSVQAMAQDLGRSAGAISQALYRIRQSLVDCLNSALAPGCENPALANAEQTT